jgi:hypothetical protein
MTHGADRHLVLAEITEAALLLMTPQTRWCRHLAFVSVFLVRGVF